jgi:hypothetical protein
MKPRTVAVCLLCLALPIAAQAAAEEESCPLHAQHQAENAAQLDARGDRVMGFEHTRTTHRFLIEPDGGAVQVEVNDATDSESLGQIRRHLAQVAESFARGDFSMPLAIHQRVLPGVAEMTRLAGAIQYRYEELEQGARVRITTQDAAARAAIHAFLEAQIVDHRTGG